MKTKGHKLAAKQKELKLSIKVLLEEHPVLANTASGQVSEASELQSIYENACDADATITEYTCVYVAMLVVKNPKMTLATQVGLSVRASLGSALATLKANRQTKIFSKEVDEIQDVLNKAVEDTK